MKSNLDDAKGDRSHPWSSNMRICKGIDMCIFSCCWACSAHYAGNWAPHISQHGQIYMSRGALAEAW